MLNKKIGGLLFYTLRVKFTAKFVAIRSSQQFYLQALILRADTSYLIQ